MFYSKLILVNSGPLADVWIAAHWSKKLTKQKITQIDLIKSVDFILNLSVPLALRLSGNLLLGIVNIYSKKVQYLSTDCNEALVRIKLAFHPGEAQIDLRPEATTAAYSSITLHLPTETEELEVQQELPIAEVDEMNLLNLNIATKKQITLAVRAVEEETETWGDIDPLLEDETTLAEPPSPAPQRQASPAAPLPQDEIEGGGVIAPDIEEELETVRRESGVSQGGGLEPEQLEELKQLQLREEDDLSPEELERKKELEIQQQQAPTTVEQPQISPPKTSSSSEEVEAKKPQKRKIGVVIDKGLLIPSSTLSDQINDTSSLIREFIPAPPTKKAMLRRERQIAGPERSLYIPVIPGMNPEILKFYAEFRIVPIATAPVEEEQASQEIAPEAHHPPHFEDEERPGMMETNIEDEERPGMIEPNIEDEERQGMVEPPQETERREQEEEEESNKPVPLLKGTEHFRRILQAEFNSGTTEYTFQTIPKLNRKGVFNAFFGLLNLASRGDVKVSQEEPFGPIVIVPTEKLNEPLPLGREVPAH